MVILTHRNTYQSGYSIKLRNVANKHKNSPKHLRNVVVVLYSTDPSKAVVPVLVLLFVVVWFIVRGDLFYVLHCVFFFSPFSIAIIYLVEERELILVLFVRLLNLRLFGLFPLRLGVWEGLQFVTLPFLYILYMENIRNHWSFNRISLMIPNPSGQWHHKIRQSETWW